MKRQLAAILFADIAGYTSLMQTDEKQASTNLEKFKSTLESEVEAHAGQVVNFYGDGCLCIFNSAVDAMNCAKSVQKQFLTEPKVPVRIGLHSGDVFFKDDNVYGDSVNLASRVESLGLPGSILFSKEIQRNISNQSDFEYESLGEFEFKNVKEPMEVFALSNEGFIVPEKGKITGKLKPFTFDSDGSFIPNIWKKKIPQILVAYLLMAWLIMQLFSWASNAFGISPVWSKIAFIAILGLMPSLVIYLNNRERINKLQLKLSEKIIFPSNLALIGLILFMMLNLQPSLLQMQMELKKRMIF